MWSYLYHVGHHHNKRLMWYPLDMVVVPPKTDDVGRLGEVVRLRIDEPLLTRLDAVAKETGRKRSDVMRRLMVAGLELHEKDGKKGKR